MTPNLDAPTDEQAEEHRAGRRRTPSFQQLGALLALAGILTVVLALPVAYAVHGDWTLLLCALGVFTLVAIAVLASRRS